MTTLYEGAIGRKAVTQSLTASPFASYEGFDFRLVETPRISATSIRLDNTSLYFRYTTPARKAEAVAISRLKEAPALKA